MQRPPSLSWHQTDSFAMSHLPQSRISELQRCVAELTDGRRTPDAPSSNNFSMASLAGLCAYLWPASYSQQNRYGGTSFVIESLTLWKADFVESACENWLHQLGQIHNPSFLAIYHMMNIMLHANLTVLQYFAHSPPGSATRDAKRSAIGREIHAWTQSRHYEIARWHAEHLLASIERAVGASFHSISPQPTASTDLESPGSPYEAPHVPYAIYHATLVMWCGTATGKMTTSSSLTAQALIAWGQRILSLHKLHIAQLLARVLNEMK